MVAGTLAIPVMVIHARLQFRNEGSGLRAFELRKLLAHQAVQQVIAFSGRTMTLK
jgi:hypothetical protein